MTNKTKTNVYHDTDSDDDDNLDELREAALKSLYSNKRKNVYDHSPKMRQNSRSSSSSRSILSRSYSSSSLSSISSNSLDKHDEDYRFQTKEKSNNGDIDERFSQNIPNDDDTLIVNCPFQDDDLLIKDEPQPVPIVHHSHKQKSKTISRHNHKKSPSIEQIDEYKKSPPIEHPISVTVKLNSEEFDLRQLIKKRRNNESLSNNKRIVQILPKHEYSESRRLDQYYKH